MNFSISRAFFTNFSPAPLNASYHWDKKSKWWEQCWPSMIGTYDFTTIIGPNILCLCLNVIYSETKRQFIQVLDEIPFPHLTYLNRAMSRLINNILTKSIWKANITLVTTNVAVSCLAFEKIYRFRLIRFLSRYFTYLPVLYVHYQSCHERNNKLDK